MVKQVTPLKTVEEGQTPWNTNRQPVGCPHCQRAFLVQESQVNSPCPLCRQGHLEPQPIRLSPGAPEKLLPFKITPHHLPAIYTTFTSGVWIRPDDFTPQNLLQRCQAVFWPLWLVDSDVKGQWQMEAGFDYQVESSKEYYQNGGWQSRKIREDRIRWEPRRGTIDYHIDNVPAPALEEHKNRWQMTGAYNLDAADAFQPVKLNNALIEVPDLPPVNAWPLAKPQINKTLGEVCAKASDAQHVQNFALKATYENLNWTQFLLPMYATYYLDDEGQPQILIVNGETGKIEGPRLASQKRGLRIAAVVAGAAVLLLLLAIIAFLLTAIFPPASIIGAFLGILGLGTGIGAIIPAIWPWQWNRKEQSQKIVERD